MIKLRSLLLTCYLLINSCTLYAQVTDIFTWSNGKIIEYSCFMDDIDELYKVSSNASYQKKEFIESRGSYKYKIELLSPYDFHVDNDYEQIFIKNATTGEVLLKTEGALGVLSGNIQFLTAWQSKAPYLMLPLDDESFALFFAGLLYTGDEAPEMMIVVVRGNEAKVVFDKKAYVYKYTPYPNYSAEYVEDIEWFMTQPDVMPPVSVFNKLKRFKIWQEGNILKYKPLN